MNSDEKDLLNTVITRLTLVESDLDRMTGLKKMIMGLLGVFALYFISSVYGYGQLNQRMNDIDLSDFKTNITTALTVLADHGTELETVRAEQFRIREHMDDIANEMRDRTQDRFYKQDAIDMIIRIKELEEEHQEYFYTKKEYPAN